tara:strand:- start:459 stop:767 length:309 start_codon:yes stop_codon:yes gene_type:complete
MIYRNIIALITVLAFGSWGFPVLSQGVNCFDYGKAVQRLADRGEQIAVGAVDGNGNLVLIFTSQAGDFTITVQIQKGDNLFLCPLVDGNGWNPIPPKWGSPS